MDTKNKVIVRIYGQEYNMVGIESREYMQKLANFVDDKMVETARNSKKLSTAMIAVLTALNITDEYFKTKEELEVTQKSLAKPLEELDQAREELGTIRMVFSQKEADYIKVIDELECKIKQEQKEKEENKEDVKIQEQVKDLQSTVEDQKKLIQRLSEESENLQRKLMESKTKYLQTKKELDNFIETFDEKNKETS